MNVRVLMSHLYNNFIRSEKWFGTVLIETRDGPNNRGKTILNLTDIWESSSSRFQSTNGLIAFSQSKPDSSLKVFGKKTLANHNTNVYKKTSQNNVQLKCSTNSKKIWLKIVLSTIWIAD